MDKRFYNEFKELRKCGASVKTAFEWACMMRACDYDPFIWVMNVDKLKKK